MTVSEATTAKIQQMSEPQLQEVQNFIDFLMLRGDSRRWQILQHLSESAQLAEAGMPDYLARLESYEDQLARREVTW